MSYSFDTKTIGTSGHIEEQMNLLKLDVNGICLPECCSKIFMSLIHILKPSDAYLTIFSLPHELHCK